MNDPSQLCLSRPEWFKPVPTEPVGHYVAALQSMSGELDALRHASARTWARLTPIVQVLGPKTSGQEPYRHARVQNWVKKIADAVGDRVCFLDTIRLGLDRLVTVNGEERPILAVLHAEARRRQLSFVPVVRLDHDQKAVMQVSEAVGCDGRGVALRCPLLGTISVDGPHTDTKTLVKGVLAAIELDFTGADLLLDLGYIDERFELDAEYVAPVVDAWSDLGEWRSVVLLGSSMPRSLGGGIVKEGTIGRLPRREWDLWSNLARIGPARLPVFGDYGVQHPDPPREPGGPGMRANVRYTSDPATIVPRGVGSFTQEGAAQYVQLCQQLVEQPEFAGPEFSWGDRQIADCAEGARDPKGSQGHWRGAGTSHHLRHVVDQLARITPR